jgi:hypothetical protein
VTLRKVRGDTFTRSYPLRIPRDMRRGVRQLRFTGVDADIAEDGLLGAILIGDEGGDGGGNAGPPTLRALARRIRGLHRYDGVRVRTSGGRTKAFRDRRLRISGRATARVRVVRR